MPRKGRLNGEREANPKSVAATDLGLLILSSFSFERPELGLTELAEALGEYRSRVHRAVTTLVHRGFLVRNPLTEKYRLGLKMFELGNIVASQIDLLRDAEEPLKHLSQETDATAWLDQRDGDEVVDLLKVEPSMPLLVRRRVGSRTPLTFGVVGQLYLAHLPDDEVDRLLESYPTVGYSTRLDGDQGAYRRQLERVRTQGYAASVDGVYAGITSIAAPVRDHTGVLVAAVALSVPTAQVAAASLGELSQRVLATAASISRRLGYLEPASARGNGSTAAGAG